MKRAKRESEKVLSWEIVKNPFVHSKGVKKAEKE